MKKLLKLRGALYVMLSVIFIAGCLAACGSDDEDEGTTIGEDFYGTYCYTYDNIYLYYTFDRDKTGRYELVNKKGITSSYAEYTYSFKGNTIKLKGVKMNTDGVVDPNWTTTLEYRGGYVFWGEQQYQKIY